MVQIKGHKKMQEQHRGERKWPKKYLPETTPGKCPFCKKYIKNLEKHIHDKHKTEYR